MKRSVKILWRVFFGGIIFIILLFASASWGLFGKMPSLLELENPEADLASEIYSSDGKLMGKYYAENRSEVKYSEISPNIIKALVATEDQYFYDHSGIDAKAVARAVLKFGTDGGGSPITQQLAKMMLHQGRGNVLKRGLEKIKEWVIAVKLERNFTKEEIITLYLNRAPWGGNYGIRNAARTYFQKEPKDLNIEESAVLVGMLKGFIYDPIRHPLASLKRRNTVIERMVDCKQQYLSEAEATKLKAKPLVTNYKKADENVGIAPYFRMVLADKMKEWCKTHKNPKTGENYDLYRDGLKIYTTINSTMQAYAEDAVNEHMPVIQKKLNSALKYNGDKMWKGHENVLDQAMKSSERWKIMQEDGDSDEVIKKTFFVPVKMKVFAWNAKRELDTVMTPMDSIKYHKQLLQTSFACMDPRTGEVKCWVGGIDFKWFKFDHVTTSRQVGSTFKPLLYTLAVQDLGYTLGTNIPGGPLTLDGKTISTAGGTMAHCLAKSLNGAAWHIMAKIGVKRTIEFAQQCGIKAKIPPYPSIALGVSEIPLLEMLRAYTMFPNKGYNTEPIFYTKIEDKDGNVLQEFNSESKPVINENDAFTMVKMMEGVVQFGTGRSLANYGITEEKAGKTGTTNGNSDGWFLGYTPELLAGTWVGCDDPFLRIYSTGGGSEMALPKWGHFMKKVYDDKSLPYGKVTAFEEPASMINDPINAEPDLLEKLVNQGDDFNENMGNGDANDYGKDSIIDLSGPTSDDLTDAPVKIDTSKKNKNKTSDKKDLKPAATLQKTDPKAKKPAVPEKKKSNVNDY